MTASQNILSIAGASNFYWYGNPSNGIISPHFPSGHKITTQLPAGIIKARIISALALTACFVAGVTGSTVWSWPVVILGITFAAYTAYKYLSTKDLLAEAFYIIAGGKENYDNLPEIALDSNKNTFDNCLKISWGTLTYPIYRFTTSDGRKGLLVKGLSVSTTKPEDPLETVLNHNRTHVQAVMAFVEKFGPCDYKENWNGSAMDVLAYALSYWVWEYQFSPRIFHSANNDFGNFREKHEMGASISTDMANEFIEQRKKGIVNLLEPRIVEIQD